MPDQPATQAEAIEMLREQAAQNAIYQTLREAEQAAAQLQEETT